jgi:osmoprotectant transport system ATP-binding protein
VIRLERVSKRYGNGTIAVHELDLDVGAGETCVLVGPSGCGKTTTMKMINRLVEPTSGRIVLDGDDVTRVDPVELRRRIGYVIQQVGLFPHQTVADNIATVPRLLGWDKRRARARVGELLELVGLDEATFAGRYPSQLSGGQRQRVGVARALAADPPVLLMDEPFGAIDPITRDRLQNEFLRLQAEVKKTVVFVTHDVDEAVKLGDRIAVMRQGGYLEQYAAPADILGAPATDFVADFVGADRGLKRLTVTRIDLSTLEQPPQVRPGASAEEVRAAVIGTDSRWAVVVDADQRLHGYVAADRPGDVRRLPAWVDANSTLKDALGEMLLSDAAWVAVLDGERYLGIMSPNALVSAFRQSVSAEAPR